MVLYSLTRWSMSEASVSAFACSGVRTLAQTSDHGSHGEPLTP